MIESTTLGQVQSLDPRTYQALVLASALRYYARTNVPVNSSYTPRNMMRTAAAITGKKFKARDYLGAAAALVEWMHA